MAIETRFEKCPGLCGERKYIQVFVQYNGTGREIAVKPSPCDDCQRAARRTRS
jgi:hypothetical protein